MFSKNILLYLLLFITVSAHAQLPTTGLSAWYPFCGNVADRSGNGLDLNLSGPSTTTSRFGNAASAYSFNGNTTVSSNIISRTPPMTDTGDFTYAAWFMADTTGNRIIVANGNINVDGCAIVLNGHNVAIAVGPGLTYLPTYVTMHQWHQVLLRKSGVTYSMYVDTAIVGAFTTPFISAPAAQRFAIGQDYTNGSKSFVGKIDDVAIYNRALNAAEIGQLYRFNPDVHAVLGNDAAVCAGFSTTLTPSPQYPGLNYVWSNGSTDTAIVADTFGHYWFSITRPYGCTTSDTITFTLGTVSVNIGRDTSVCNGDTFVLVPTVPPGSNSFLWSTGDTTATLHIVTPGVYTLSINNFGCPGYDTMVFGNSPIPTVTLGPDTAICSIYTVTLESTTVYPGATYLWSNGATTQQIHPTASGNYVLRELVDGCPGFDTIHVTIKPNPVVSFGVDRSLCQGDSIILSSVASAGATYMWSTGEHAPQIVVRNTGNYWLTATDNGCTATDTINVIVYPFPLVHLGPDISVCQSGPITLKSTDVYSSPGYVWSTGATTPTITTSVSGSFTLTVTQHGCTSQDDINVTIKPVPVVNLGPDSYFCSGSSFPLSSTQASTATYIWSTGATSSSISVSTPGLYGLVVTDNGCTGSDSVQLDRITTPIINLGPDTTLCQSFVMQLNIDGDRATYLWSDGSTGTSHQITQTEQVWATITNACGVATDTINVRYRFCDVWLPNAFSPNGDGRNDIMRVKGTLASYTNFKFMVFNRWGVNIFLSEDINTGWDGTYKNEKMDIGTYYYIMTCTLNGQELSMKGDFELVR